MRKFQRQTQRQAYESALGWILKEVMTNRVPFYDVLWGMRAAIWDAKLLREDYLGNGGMGAVAPDAWGAGAKPPTLLDYTIEQLPVGGCSDAQ